MTSVTAAASASAATSTSVTTMAAIVIVLFTLLLDSGRAITISSDKKVTANGSTRDTQSLTFSENGQDQLIFSDSSFQVKSEVPQQKEPIRRASGEQSTSDFFESGWRPVYSFNLEASPEKISDQLPQEAVQQPQAVVAEPWNRTTRFFRFSESDIVQGDQVQRLASDTPLVPIRFKEFSSSEEFLPEVASRELNTGEQKPAATNLTEITPRMLKFEEDDRMKFEDDSPKGLGFSSELVKSQPEIAVTNPGSYEVYLIENLMKNTNSSLRASDSAVAAPVRKDIPVDTQPRIVKNLDEAPLAEKVLPAGQRNASRFFRFEESDRVTEKKRYEKSPENTFKIHKRVPTQDEFKFPKNEDFRRPETQYSSGGSFKFQESDSRPQESAQSQTHFEETRPVQRPLKFFNSAPIQQQKTDEGFYTVKATIQIGGYDGAVITPPTVPVTTKKPKQKKKGKIYNQNAIDIRKQDGFNYQQPPDYDNYIQNSPPQPIPLSQYQSNSQYQATNQYQTNIPIPVNQYQNSYQIPPTPQTSTNNLYYQNLDSPSPGTPYPPYDPNTYYIQNYLANYPQTNPVQQQPIAEGSASYPSVYPQQQQLTADGVPSYPSLYQQPTNVPTNLLTGGGAQSGSSPLSAQSIFGYLQSIFNFAPGTFGNYPPTPSSSSSQSAGAPQYQQQQQQQHQSSSPGTPSPIMAVSSQLRRALDNIAENDELQCVPKLICMMSRRSTGQGFSTYVNRGLLTTILNAVPDSSPWLKFSRAALLGYGIGANSCDVYYPKCPKDESEIIFYLNNHRGGFFRFFNDEHDNNNGGGVSSASSG